MTRPLPLSSFLLLLLAALIGVGGALSAIIFRSAFASAQIVLSGHADGMVAVAMGLPWWARLTLPVLGAFAAGWLLRLGLQLKSAGNNPRRDDYLEALTLENEHADSAHISVRQTLVKSLSSLCSIGTGASIGREGPMVQLAAMVGSLMCRIVAPVIKLNPAQARIFVACGAVAGITSAYNAPIAGVMFVLEIALGEMTFGALSREMLGPLIVASVTANIITREILHLGAVYDMPHFALVSGWEVFAYAGLGLLCGLVAPVFRTVLDSTRALFKRLPIGLVARMVLGGLGVGVISVFEPAVWGNGYSVVNAILHAPDSAAQWGWRALLAILIFKLLATAMSAGSGTVGGVFTPTLFVGAVLGALYGHAMVALAPLADTQVSGYIIVGMGAFLAAVTYAPMMCILMIFEMTLSYEVILPLMLACVLGREIAGQFRAHSIYAEPLVRLKPEATS